MNATPVGEIQFRFHMVHTEVLQFLEGLTEAQLGWQPHPSVNPIAFFAWHLARWADYVQAHSAFDQRLKPRHQIWHAENLAAKWGLDPATLGELETGWEMDPAGAARMPLPGNVAKAYRKRFNVDWITAFKELELLGVQLDSSYKEQVLKSVQAQAEAKKRKRAEKRAALERTLHPDQDEHFAYIAGYTNWGFPYGLTWEELEALESESESDNE